VDLAAPATVRASTEGSAFDTVLHHHQGTCQSTFEVGCDDDGGPAGTSVLVRSLQAGTHYFVVDGFGGASSGAYVLELVIM
jgi:hypothetical protein